MASTQPIEEEYPRTKKKYQRRVKDSSNVRRSNRVRVPKIERDPVSDSERVLPVNGRPKCIRWTTLEKQLLLRALQEKSAVSQFNYLAIKRIVKTKKKSDVEIFIRNLRKRAMKAKIDSVRKKSPIEIWRELMNHFGDQDRETLKAMSKVMAMASLERTRNAAEVTCDDFKPTRVYRYLGALFRSRALPVLTPLESRVILDCFENMLEVLKGSEVRDKAAFLRSQYFTLFNMAYTGGNEYGLQDNLNLVYKEAEEETQVKANQPGSSSVSSRTVSDATASVANPGTSRTEPSTLENGTDLAGSSRNPGTNGTGLHTSDSVPGTSGNNPGSSGVRQSGSGLKKRASWQGGVDRSAEVRLLNPLGIPVEMLEFKPRDDESYVRKRWTYVDTTDSSDSDDSDGDSFDDEEDDSHGLEGRRDQGKRKEGRPLQDERTGTDQGSAQETAGTGAGEPNGLQEMTDLLTTDQYALVTEEEFARKGRIYLQAMAEAHTDSDSHQDIDELVGSEQYVFVSKDELATEGDRSVAGIEEVERGEDEVQETGDMDDQCQSTATGDDYLCLEHEYDRQELSSTQLESDQYEIDDQVENDDSSGNEGSEIDQSETIDESIDPSELLGGDMGPSDGDVDRNQPEELRAEMSSVGDKNRSSTPENTKPTPATTVYLRSPASKQEDDGITNMIPPAPDLSVVEQPSRKTIVQYLPQTDCHWIERPFQGVPPQLFPRVASEPTEAVQASGSRSLHQNSPAVTALPVACHQAAEATPTQVLPSDQTLVSNSPETDATQVLPNQHFQVASNSPLKRVDAAYIPSASASKLHTDKSDLSEDVKSKPVRFRLHQKKSQSNESPSQEPPDDPTPKTIPLVNAIDTGMVSSDKSDDQLLTIDLSQLGPDSNIVIPSYLLPGGILTIRSPNVARMGIQRSDPSLLPQAGTNSAVSNNDIDVSSQSWDDTSHRVHLHESIPADMGPGSDEESSIEDDISQTEYVIASDQPSKESHDLCEVHVIASHIKKSSSPTEVPLSSAPKEQQIIKQENSPKELLVSKKPENSKDMPVSSRVEASNRLQGLQSENAKPETEERSFLEFLSSQTSAWKWKEQSATEKCHLPEGNLQLEAQNFQAQAVHNVNIPISKSWQDKNKNYEFAGGAGLSRVGKTSGHHPQTISKHKASGPIESMKQKNGNPPNARIQPYKQVCLGQMGQDTPSARSLHNNSPPKMRSTPPLVVPKEVIDNQVIRNKASSSIDLRSGEKRKRGRPPKCKPSTDPRLSLTSEMQQVGSAGPSTEGKRKRGRPRKIDSRAPVDLENLVLENEETHGRSEEDHDEKEATATPEESEHIGERVVVEKRKRGRPPKCVEGKSVSGVANQSGTDSLSESLEKRKRGRPKKGSGPGSYSILPADLDHDQSVETEVGVQSLLRDHGTDSDTESKEKRKRGRPCKKAQPGSPGEIGSGWLKIESGLGKELKRKRGRPRKELAPDSLANLPDSSVICQSAENDSGSGGLETESETESQVKQKRQSPRRESRQNSCDDVPDKIIASSPAVGISRTNTAKTELKRMTELKGDHSKDVSQDKAKTSIIETNVTVAEGEKRKRGRPRKELPPDSLADLPDSPVICQSAENDMRSGRLEAESETESQVKQKRQSPRRESRQNSCDDVPDKIIASAPAVGISRTSTAKTELKRTTELKGDHSKDVSQDKAKTSIIETNVTVAEGEKRKRGRPRKELPPDSLADLPDSPVICQSAENDMRSGRLEAESETESQVKQKRQSPRRESRQNSCDDVPDKIIASAPAVGILRTSTAKTELKRTTELKGDHSKDVSQDKAKTSIIETNVTVAEGEKRKRGRPRKELPPDCLADLADSPVICQSEENDRGSGRLETESETESQVKQKRQSPRRESRQNSCDDVPGKIIASSPAVGISRTSTAKTELKRMTELKGGHSKDVSQDKAKTSIIETDVMVAEREKRKRGRPPKRVRADSLEKTVVSHQATVSKSSIGQLDAVSRREIGEKRKRGRPRRASRPNSFNDRNMASQASENAVGTGHLETDAKTRREEMDKGGRPSLEFIPNNPYPVTDVKTGSEQCLAERVENSKEGQCKPEIKPAPKYILFYRVINSPSAVENKAPVRRYREIRPAPPKTFDKVTSGSSVERKGSISPLSAGADRGPEKQRRRRRPFKRVQKDVTTKDTAYTKSKSSKETAKSRRGRPRKELRPSSLSDPQSSQVQGQSREPDTSNNHVEHQDQQKIGNLQNGARNEVYAEGTRMCSPEKGITVGHAGGLSGMEQKLRRGRSGTAVKPDANLGSKSPKKQKRGRPSKRVDTGSSDVGMESTVIKNQSRDKEGSINHTETASRAGAVEDSTADGTLRKARVDSTRDSHMIQDIPQLARSETGINNAVSRTGQEMENNGSRPYEKLGFAGAPRDIFVSKTLPTGELSVGQTLSEVVKQASLSNGPPSNESGTYQSPGKATKSILKKHKKRGPLKVTVGKELADKRQKSLAGARHSQAHSFWSQSAPFTKPVTSILHEGDLLFSKPKKRVSFEDAIDLVDTLGEGEVLGKDLLMTDIVSQTAMKEVLKIVKEVRVDRESVLAPQAPKKTSVFFSIKKS